MMATFGATLPLVFFLIPLITPRNSCRPLYAAICVIDTFWSSNLNAKLLRKRARSIWMPHMWVLLLVAALVVLVLVIVAVRH